MEPWESWRAKLLHRKLLYRGHHPLLRRDRRDGHWQVVLPVVADGRESHHLHFGPMRHDKESELRTIQLRDVSGAVRTVRLQDLSSALSTVAVRDAEGRERQFKIAVLPEMSGAASTPLERDVARAHSILALQECSWLLSGWDRLHRQHQLRAPRSVKPARPFVAVGSAPKSLRDSPTDSSLGGAPRPAWPPAAE